MLIHMVCFVVGCVLQPADPEFTAPSLSSSLSSTNTKKVPSIASKFIAIHNPEEFKNIVDKTPEYQLFPTVFSIAETDVAHLDIAEIVTYANVLPVEIRIDFYDGIAHGRNWNVPTPEMDFTAIAQHIPTQYHERLWNGYVMAVIIYFQGNAKQSLRQISKYMQKFPYDFTDGLRVGVQRLYGDDIPKALQVVSTFPKQYRGKMLEELGWKVGEHNSNISHSLDILLPQISENLCAFMHGVARGNTMITLSNEQYDVLDKNLELLTHKTPSCVKEIRRGVEEACQIAHTPNSIPRIMAMMDSHL